ncbi:hypothetical protein BASA81_006628 [Batrachochytrium salamandrivorans]|nr:hypothetical protein BASA81_006628 [Batrachochytrium salamandrivorans]
MNSSVDMFRANAIRVLCKIVEANMLMQIERYVKQALVDRDDQVAACALMCADQMATADPAKKRVVSNWVAEIQNALGGMGRLGSVQYQALLVLYRIKSQDRLAVSKLVFQLSSNPNALQAPLAIVMLVRYTARMLQDESCTASESSQAFRYLVSCLRNKSECVVYEAARAICRLPGVTQEDVQPAVATLANFLKSGSSVTRFAASRTLSEVAIRHPQAVSKANFALESLIADRNRNVATMAITTLLKTGHENQIESLTKQISMFMTELADEFKIVVVVAIRALALKYRRKHRSLLGFLSSVLREEGGYEIKRCVVDTVLEVMENIPEAQEVGLFHLCEFIEDCEFTSLSTQILHVLGELGPKMQNPQKLIRYVYNRVILENAQVRAAAVSSLGAFAIRVPNLQHSVCQLLKRCQQDEDDEVRDRASTFLSLISQDKVTNQELELELLTRFSSSQVDKLEEQLLLFQQEGENVPPLCFENLPAVQEKERTDQQLRQELARKEPSSLGGTISMSEDSFLHERAQASLDELLSIKEFAKFGTLFKSCPAVELTERETEYLVRVVKHVFAKHVVLQFFLTNTLNDQVLKDCTVKLGGISAGGWKQCHMVPVKRLPYDVTKSCFVGLEQTNQFHPTAEFTAQLAFTVVDVDPDASPIEAGMEEDEDEGFAETYAVNNLELTFADFMLAEQPKQGDFKTNWELIGDGEIKDQFALTEVNSIQQAVKSVTECVGMRACEGTEQVANAAKHTLLLNGTFLEKQTAVMAIAMLIVDDKKQVVLRIAVRSKDIAVAQQVMEAITG